MNRIFSALIAVSLLAGCRFGPKIDAISLARAPRGAMFEVSRVAGVVNGELLAVTDDALVILEGGRMVNVPFVEIRDARSRELGKEYRIRDQKQPGPEVIARLRRVSHFPQGITPEIEAKLLTIYQK